MTDLTCLDTASLLVQWKKKESSLKAFFLEMLEKKQAFYLKSEKEGTDQTQETDCNWEKFSF